MLRLITAAACLLMLTSCGSDADEAERPPDEAERSAEELLDRAFLSVSVTEGDGPRQLATDDPIRLAFEERDDRDVVRWRAGCNTYGGTVNVTAERLLLGEISGTQVGCRDELHEQDEWLVGFFAADPRWRLGDDMLTLTSGEAVIELEAVRD